MIETRTTSDLRRRFADLDALAGVRRVELTEGRARGLEVAEVWNAAGLRFDVLLGRGLDIGRAAIAGTPISWRSPVGDVAPAYYDSHDIGWLRSFHGGMLVGCGLRHAGAPSTDGTTALGVHGRLSNTPAEGVVTEARWEDAEPVVEVRGRVRETRVLGENLRLERTIRCLVWSNRIVVADVVTNDGCDPTPHMYLLHLNLGFPLVSEASEFVAPILGTTPRDDVAARGLPGVRGFGSPDPGNDEEVFFHQLASDADGRVSVGVVREHPNPLGLAVRYGANQFPWFAHWKVLRPGAYAMALEPANCLVMGMQAERAAGRLVVLEPGESRSYNLEIEVLTSARDIARLRERVARSVASSRGMAAAEET